MTDEKTILQVAVGLIALRSFLAAGVAFLDWLDTRDGRRDWKFVRTLANTLEALDRILEFLPVKAPLKRGR